MTARFPLVLAFALSAISSVSAQRPAALVGFGDSLSDNGNLFALTGQPAAPYWQGRFSNGRVWIEQLAADLQLSSADFEDIAIAGSTTDDIVAQQVLPYIAQNQGNVRSDALYVLWGGANDLLALLSGPGDPQAVISNAVTNLSNATLLLAAAGGQRFLWVNLPDIGLTPRVQASGDPATIIGATTLAAAFNQGMQLATQALAGAGIQVDILDSFELTRDMVAHPMHYRLWNVTSPALRPNGTVVHKPNRHLFFDDIHPTEAGHEEIMVEALRVLSVARRGDLNGDYRLSGHDVHLLFHAWGPAAAGSPADLNSDGCVNFADFWILRALIKN